MKIFLTCISSTGAKSLSTPDLGEIALLLPNTIQVDVVVEGEGELEVSAWNRVAGKLYKESGSGLYRAPERVTYCFRPGYAPAALQFCLVEPAKEPEPDVDEGAPVEFGDCGYEEEAEEEGEE